MADYQEQHVVGTTWKRCKDLTLTNPHSSITTEGVSIAAAVPTIIFYEEEVMALPNDRFILSAAGACAKEFNHTGTIAILDPLTGESSGTSVSHAYLYQILYSLYMQTALERDTRDAAVSTIEGLASV